MRAGSQTSALMAFVPFRWRRIVDAGGVGGQAFLGGQHADVVGHGRQALLRERQHAGAAQEIVGRQAAGEAGRAAGRQHVRRPGDVIAQGHRRVGAQEDRAGVVDLVDQAVGVRGRNVQMLRAELVGPGDRLVRRRGPAPGRRTLPGCRGPARRAAAWPAAVPAAWHLVQQRLVPGDQDAGGRDRARPGRSGRRRRSPARPSRRPAPRPRWGRPGNRWPPGRRRTSWPG